MNRFVVKHDVINLRNDVITQFMIKIFLDQTNNANQIFLFYQLYL